VTEFVSLDGVVQGPGGPDEDRDGGFAHGGWAAPYIDDEVLARAIGVAARADALLLGRRTYEGFAAAWPSRSGDAFSEKFNSMPKHVVSSTLSDPEWNNSTVLEGDLADSVASLKKQYEGDILVNGSVQLVREMAEKGLIDELRLMVFPTVLGEGKRLFDQHPEALDFELVESRPAAETLILIFRPKG